MKTKKVIIIGTGGGAVEILNIIKDLNLAEIEKLECIGFLDNKPNMGKLFQGIKVYKTLSQINLDDVFFVNGVGSPQSYLRKAEILNKLSIPSKKYLTLIHPTAYVSNTAKLGRGVVISQNVSLTTHVKIGNHVVILPGAIISHDNIIGDYCIIASGAVLSGRVKIGKSCYLGANCSIKEDINIGNNSLIGIGSVVLNNIPSDSVFVGNPARFLK